MTDQNTAPQDSRNTPQDNAENRMDQHTPSHWSAEKHDLQTHEKIADNPLPVDQHAAPRHLPLPVLATFPEEFTPPTITPPATYAAGLPAVFRSLKHLFSQTNPLTATRAMLNINQKGGFDCMSCAWPESDGKRHIAEFCENGAKAVAWETTAARATPDFFAKHSIHHLSQQSEYWLGQQGRITHPMLLDKGATHYTPISWDSAFALLAHELNALSSPDEAIFYTSGRTSNEAAFLYQLFVRQFGTNNLPDCSNMCHESSGAALTDTLGIGKGTVTLDDFLLAKVILIIGQNPGTNHPRMLTTLEAAKHNGAKIIAINPLPEAGLLRFKNPQTVRGTLLGGTQLADLFLQIKIGEDIPLLKAIAKDLLERNALDHPFIDAHTAGIHPYLEDLRNTPWQPLLQNSGIPRDQIRHAADLLASSDRIIACWAMGLTQNKHAVYAIQEVVNLLLLRGAVGKPGAGACPVRGHSNVQGDRSMGIWERPRKEFLDSLQSVFHFDPPRHHGLDTVESIRAMHAGKAKLFFAMGGNFLSASPDTDYTAKALMNTRLTAHVSLKLNRSHLITGARALILPALGRTEIDIQTSGPQFVTTENSMGVVESSQGILTPASPHLLSEPAIVCQLAAQTLGNRTRLNWPALAENYDAIRDLIAQTIPGCDNYNQKVRQPGGFYLPNLPRQGDFSDTPTKRANFTVHPLPNNPLAPGELVMMTLRSHDQFNTTIYGENDAYRGISHGRRVIFMNPDDIADRYLSPGDKVDLHSAFNGTTRTAPRFTVVPYPIPRQNCATYFPEGNVLVPLDSVAEKSNTPSSKYVVITLTPALPHAEPVA